MRTCDRFSPFSALAENPDYRENPGEGTVVGPKQSGAGAQRRTDE